MHRIEIRGLEVFARIGVPDDERAAPQRLLLDIEIEPVVPFHALDDDIARTVDYHAVARDISGLAGAKPRRLIETLCAECATHILDHHAARKVRVRVRKFILPDTEHVAVACEIEKQSTR